ncbi:hypothetical protein EZV62_024865 [Acer yangbiense]|uniref:DUF761 domain-containing protein n=1 Tax=Acer yangbiense TaxID=1000413 RepID=A0A5C7GWC9_9ROSI|nr:hypothetical protein EZV62_024865 [Acer yangbiense]
MKNKASAFLKQVICLVTSVAKAKSLAIKNKTNAAKARLIMLSLMKNKKVLMGSISNKIHNLLGHQTSHREDNDVVEDQSKAIVLHNAVEPHSSSSCTQYVYDDDKYPDLTHSLFDEEEFEFDDQGGSIIDIVRNSKEEGENFSLEEEIDHVADLFIKRFHKQIKLQKLESFKRFQEMIARGL